MDLEEEEEDHVLKKIPRLGSDNRSNRWFYESSRQNVKNFYHEYLPTFPKRLKRDTKVNIELPYPIYSSNLNLYVGNFWKPFYKKVDKSDTKLDYFRKIYSKSKNKVLVKDLKQTILSVPKYVIDVALNSDDETFNEVWYYTGGLLDCFNVNNISYLLYVSSPGKIRCIDINGQNLVSTMRVKNTLPIYSITRNVIGNNPILGIRQKSKICLFRSFIENSRTKYFWSKTTKNSFVDMAFNDYCDDQVCTLNSEHEVTVENIANNEEILRYCFPFDDSKLSDYLGNILLLDANTLVFTNRHSVYVLDLRSKSFITTDLKDDILICDYLCTLSKKRFGSLYISSMHNILEFDVKSMKCTNKVMHMMSTPPFISSVVDDNREKCLSLMGQNDIVLMRSTDQSLSLPQYVPKITDTLRTMCSTVKLDDFNIADGRLSFPLVGMKLYADPVTGDISLFTSNTAGDVFQQRLLNGSSTYINSVTRLTDWTKKLSSRPKELEATSICNLNKLFHSVTRKMPNEKRIQYLMKEGTGEDFVKKHLCTIEKDVKSKVGEVMDALWEADEITEIQDNAISSESKVVEWLHSQV